MKRHNDAHGMRKSNTEVLHHQRKKCGAECVYAQSRIHVCQIGIVKRIMQYENILGYSVRCPVIADIFK